jgi:hypothetical protein
LVAHEFERMGSQVGHGAPLKLLKTADIADSSATAFTASTTHTEG